MVLRDVERLMITREPVTLNGEVCRMVGFHMVFVPHGLDYIVDVMDSKGKRHRKPLSDIAYLDGRKCI